MKEFSCGDLIPGCGAHFRAHSDDEILEQVAVHARRDHGLDSIPDSLVGQVRQLIRVAA